MPGLLKCVETNGAFYFSLNFAGETVFKPEHPHDEIITRAYHADMDQRFTQVDWRASQTGHQLGQWLVEQGHKIVTEGPSDWQLQSCANRTANTNHFIADILATIENALTGLSGLPEWLVLRRQQLQAGQLQFRAANRDYFGLKGNPYMGTRS